MFGFGLEDLLGKFAWMLQTFVKMLEDLLLDLDFDLLLVLDLGDRFAGVGKMWVNGQKGIILFKEIYF